MTWTIKLAAGIIPKGFKTDAILVTESKEELEKHFSFTPGVIGGLKFETEKECINKPLVQKINEKFDIPQTVVNTFEINNEWKYDEFQELFDDDYNDTKNNWFIGSGLPGSGKSYAVSSYKNHNILFVTPFNNLAQETVVNGHDAVTCHTLLGFYEEVQDYVKMKQFR